MKLPLLNRNKQAIKILIITTKSDLSLSLFLSPNIKKLAKLTVLYYSQSLKDFNRVLSKKRFDIIYLRDPFNSGKYDSEAIKERAGLVNLLQPGARYIDQARSLDDMLFEDKFEQYKALSEFMPETSVLTKAGQFTEGKQLIKKRISARSKGIAFEAKADHWDGSYIIQPLLDIKKEYRVYCINGKVMAYGAVKSSKKSGTKVKVLGAEKLPLPILKFAKTVLGKLDHFDLVGLDVVDTKDKGIRLLEVNRSPQFKAFTKFSGINLAEELLNTLEM